MSRSGRDDGPSTGPGEEGTKKLRHRLIITWVHCRCFSQSVSIRLHELQHNRSPGSAGRNSGSMADYASGAAFGCVTKLHGLSAHSDRATPGEQCGSRDQAPRLQVHPSTSVAGRRFTIPSDPLFSSRSLPALPKFSPADFAATFASLVRPILSEVLVTLSLPPRLCPRLRQQAVVVKRPRCIRRQLQTVEALFRV